jgi:hypothetical protein
MEISGPAAGRRRELKERGLPTQKRADLKTTYARFV